MPVAARLPASRLLPRLLPIQSGTAAKPPPRCARKASEVMGATDNATTSQQPADAAVRQRPSGSELLPLPRSPDTANERRPGTSVRARSNPSAVPNKDAIRVTTAANATE